VGNDLSTAHALTLVNPVAYLAGVLKGDGWLGSPSGHLHGHLCLRVADLEFAETFALAIQQGFSLTARVVLDERGYWTVRRYNRGGLFDCLPDFEPTTAVEFAAWLRGLFDSEGCAYLRRRPLVGPESWQRSVTFTSTNTITLDRAARYLAALGIDSYRLSNKLGAGHKGTKPVFRQHVRGSREQYMRFASAVGSSIGRKQQVLDSMAGTYVEDMSAKRREMQARGVASRLSRRNEGGQY
jgi:hypothetical protein